VKSKTGFQLPPDVSFEKQRLSNAWAYVFRHRLLGEIGRILLQELEMMGAAIFPAKWLVIWLCGPSTEQSSRSRLIDRLTLDARARAWPCPAGAVFFPVHAADATNLMFSPTNNITADPPSLTFDQLKTMLASKFCIAI
jgi:hypothetical protein